MSGRLSKKTHRWNDSDKYLENRDKLVRAKGGWDDSYASDKKFLKSFEKVYYCKWCSKEMFASHYDDHGCIIMSCNTQLCPGNVNASMKIDIKPVDYDQRQLTNQYLFNGRMQF